jgi:uncharacterized coiled-coil protein SlyX
MDDRLQDRLEDLRGEFATGQQTLRELEVQVSGVRDTMLRIAGAIQVLEELVENPTQPLVDAETAGMGPVSAGQ